MKPTDLIKRMIEGRQLDFPTTGNDLISLLDRYAVAASFDFDLQDAIDNYKAGIVKAHKYRSSGDDGCYISMIKQALNNSGNVILNGVVFAVYEVDLMTKAVQELIVEEKIRVQGKKIYLINQNEA